MKILLVDDSKLQRWTIQRNLEKARFCVVAAEDGDQGLRLASEETPDAIVLDMLLPKVSGLEVLRSLRTRPETKDIPVVVLTGLSKGNEEKLAKEGAAGFCEKSEHAFQNGSARLIEIIQRALAGNKSQCHSDS